ncbi:MAG: hypothetical protein H6922_02820 [Pseudomonadaceae bacterium]|nr:hypothetical protein [Pseudomonadaceae bacterium]
MYNRPTLECVQPSLDILRKRPAHSTPQHLRVINRLTNPVDDADARNIENLWALGLQLQDPHTPPPPYNIANLVEYMAQALDDSKYRNLRQSEKKDLSKDLRKQFGKIIRTLKQKDLDMDIAYYKYSNDSSFEFDVYRLNQHISTTSPIMASALLERLRDRIISRLNNQADVAIFSTFCRTKTLRKPARPSMPSCMP